MHYVTSTMKCLVTRGIRKLWFTFRKVEEGEQKTLEIGNGNVFHVGACIL